jgi:peptidoglycan hydrolase CwlO-like protein
MIPNPTGPSGLERFMEWLGSPASIIVHTVFFAASFGLVFLGIPFDRILLVVTTVVSLEAIYLSLFIQMAVNRNTRSLVEVVEDVDEIQEDVDEIQEDVDEIQKDVDEIQKDVDVIQEDVEEIQEDVDVIQKDVDEIQEDVDDMEKDDDQHLLHGEKTQVALTSIEQQLQQLIKEIEAIKHEKK